MTYNCTDITRLLADKFRDNLSKSGQMNIDQIVELTMNTILSNRLLVKKYIGNSNKSFKRIKISNLVQGVGVVDIKITEDNKQAYEIWRNMLRRSCADELKNKKPTYSIVTVSDEWKIFSNFLKFYLTQYKDGYSLDKDILVENNSIYSSTTCCFVPIEINGLIVNIDNKKKGTYYDKTKNKYRASISIKGKTKNLGNYDSLEEAQSAYRYAKKEHILEITKRYLDDGLISLSVANALKNRVINW